MLGDEAFSVEQTIPLGGMTPLFLNVQAGPSRSTGPSHEFGSGSWECEHVPPVASAQAPAIG